MKKGLLQEIKAMNNIAGTQLTKEQEVALIRERLEQLNEGEIKMIGDDQDELLDAIEFINKGIGKGNQTVKLPFGNDTLKALDADAERDLSATYEIRVKPSKAGPAYIKGVNEFLDDHGFGCRLVDTDDYKKAALEIVALAKELMKKSGEQFSMAKEVSRASKVKNEDGLTRLYYFIMEQILGQLYTQGMKPFKKEAMKIMLDKYNLFVTDEYGFNLRNKQR
jgi:hypothetical protein